MKDFNLKQHRVDFSKGSFLIKELNNFFNVVVNCINSLRSDSLSNFHFVHEARLGVVFLPFGGGLEFFKSRNDLLTDLDDLLITVVLH
jgi:hypothetical protein